MNYDISLTKFMKQDRCGGRDIHGWRGLYLYFQIFVGWDLIYNFLRIVKLRSRSRSGEGRVKVR